MNDFDFNFDFESEIVKDPSPVYITLTGKDLIYGDSLEVLQTIQTDSVDFICTDPPYGYGFMNKIWDKETPSNLIWKECFRILKPGGFMCVMSAPRLDKLGEMIVRIRSAGFNCKFKPILWTYASGFTKSSKLSLKIDNDLMNRWFVKTFGIKLSKIASRIKNAKYNSRIFNQYMREYNSWIKFYEFKQEKIDPRHIFWKSKMNAKKEIWEKIVRANWAMKEYNTEIEYYNYSYPKRTKVISPEAIKAIGKHTGYQPKPVCEVIIIVMKPIETDSDFRQYLKNRRCVSNIDDCRIPYKELAEALKANSKGFATQGNSGVYAWNNEKLHKFKKKMLGGRYNQNARWSYGDEKVDGFKPQDFDETDVNYQGRFPPHLLVSDNVLGDLSDYFDLDFWIAERMKRLPKFIQKSFPFVYCPKPTKKEKNKGLTNVIGKKIRDGRKANVDYPSQRGESIRKNAHPTVKPKTLIRYLIALFTDRDDLVLDPFAGSGTTAIAAKEEDRRFTMVEKTNTKEEPYYSIMCARVNAHQKQTKLEKFM